MKLKLFIFPLLAINFILIAAVFLLYKQNRSFKSHNRELIIRNDSLLSVNLQRLPEKPLAQEKTVTPKKIKVPYKRS